MKRVFPDSEGLAEAAAVIRTGGIVAYPTETVYGLGVDPFSAIAVEKLFAAKGRAPSNPILLIASNIAQLAQVTRAISPIAQRYIDAFWPGPLSLVLPRHELVPAIICGNTEKVCVRVPACKIARDLCAAVGHPITSTSANMSGSAPASSIDENLIDGVALWIDAGSLPAGRPSTVFDPDTGVIHRHGAIDEATLRALESR